MASMGSCSGTGTVSNFFRVQAAIFNASNVKRSYLYNSATTRRYFTGAAGDAVGALRTLAVRLDQVRGERCTQ